MASSIAARGSTTSLLLILLARQIENNQILGSLNRLFFQTLNSFDLSSFSGFDFTNLTSVNSEEVSDLAIDEGGVSFKTSIDSGQNTSNFLDSISFNSRNCGSMSSRGINS